MAKTKITNKDLAAGLEALIEQAVALSEDYDDVVQEAVHLAREQPLPEQEAEQLFVRILTILRTAGRDLDIEAQQQIAAEIRNEAAVLMKSRPFVSDDEPSEEGTELRRGGLTFHFRHGLEPRAVAPMQTFNGVAIALTEGFVDVKTLALWKDNHRVQLHVEEFREVHHREPEDHELLLLLQGDLMLPSLDKRDPFKLKGLADSIARKGVERPPVVTWEGEPKDGNRRIAASRYVLASDDYNREEKDRARWIRVWQAPGGTTDDQFEAIVVALNFEDDHKIEWPEYVKARLVVDRYRELRDQFTGRWTQKKGLKLRKEVADQFAIQHSEVRRYLDMVHWADDFEAYHEEERGLDPAAVRYKANDVFQWFYEIQAGRAPHKLTHKIDQDDVLKQLVYDLMYDVLDSGAQVRSLHQVIVDEAGMGLLEQAHQESDADQALRLVDNAIAEAKRNRPSSKLGFEQFLRGVVNRLGSTPPDHWRTVDDELLRDLQRVLPTAVAAIESELVVRDET